MKKYGVKIKGIVKCNDEFLIVKKWLDDRIDDPYQWQFFDTTIMDDETPEEAVLRYIADSIGIFANVTSIPYTWVYRLGDTDCIGIAFLCEISDQVVFLSEDLTEAKWVKAEELQEYIESKAMLKDMHEAGIF